MAPYCYIKGKNYYLIVEASRENHPGRKKLILYSAQKDKDESTVLEFAKTCTWKPAEPNPSYHRYQEEQIPGKVFEKFKEMLTELQEKEVKAGYLKYVGDVCVEA